MNVVFFGIVLIAFVTGGATGEMQAVSEAALSSAKDAVELAIGLIGYMALFLGAIQVAQDGGLLRLLAGAIRPVMVRLFPGVPPQHPAMGAMIMNVSANMLGLGNAATPLGIKAMKELQTLNDRPGVATDAMVLFLAINTSSVAMLPTGVVAVRAAEGSSAPWSIVAPSLFATGFSTVVAITVTKLLRRLPVFSRDRVPTPAGGEGAEDYTGDAEQAEAEEGAEPHPWAVRGLALFLVLGIGVLVVPPLWASMLPESNAWTTELRDFASRAGDWVIPVLITSMLGYGALNGVRVYESFVKGAREGFDTGVKIIPYLVAILVAIGMFRASGAMSFVTATLGSATDPMGLPGEALPMAFIRSLSGSGAFAAMSEVIETQGPDSYVGILVSVLNGSTETTFYVLAVYFGSVGVYRARHAVAAGLTADLASIVGTVFICMTLFGHLR